MSIEATETTEKAAQGEITKADQTSRKTKISAANH